MCMSYFVVCIEDFYVINLLKFIVKFGLYSIIVFEGKIFSDVYCVF